MWWKGIVVLAYVWGLWGMGGCKKQPKSPKRQVVLKKRVLKRSPQRRALKRSPKRRPSSRKQPLDETSRKVCTSVGWAPRRCGFLQRFPVDGKKLLVLGRRVLRELHKSTRPEKGCPSLALMTPALRKAWPQLKPRQRKGHCLAAQAKLVLAFAELFSQMTMQKQHHVWKPSLISLLPRLGPLPSKLRSRISFRSWELSPADPRLRRGIAGFLGRQMLHERSCPVRIVHYLARHFPQFLQTHSAKFKPAWCKLRRLYLNTSFRTFAQIEKALQELAHLYRGTATLRRFGSSYEKRALWALRLGEAKTKGPHVVMVAGQHAREHGGPELVLDLAERLLEGYRRKDARIARWFRTRTLWLIPVLNPDGKAFDQLGGLLKYWRYNRSPRKDGGIGVDLNRNYSSGWRPKGSCSQKYSGANKAPGERPFSVPETQALRDFLAGLPRVTALLDIHQYGRFVLRPRAASSAPLAASNRGIYEALCGQVASASRMRCFRAHKLYHHCGSLGDWGWFRLGAFSLTLEVGCKFYVSPKQMHQMIQGAMGALYRFIELSGRGMSAHKASTHQSFQAALPPRNSPCTGFHWRIDRGH